MQCVETGCQNHPEFAFMWPWGEAAACCSAHRINVQQKSDALDRGPISFTVLDPHKPEPLTRDARTGLIAARLAAEEEANEVKAECQRLTQERDKLVEEGRRLHARVRTLEEQLGTEKGRADLAIVERDTALADLHDERQAHERTKLLVPTPNP